MQAEAGIEAFPWPTDFKLTDYCIGGYFGVSQGKTVQLSFHIEKECGQHLLESPLSADEQVADFGDCFEITVTVVETEFLLLWLSGWGDKISKIKMAYL